MPSLAQLLVNNRQWAAHMTADDPEFFRRLAHQQAPQYLWIGCADSRVPANEIVGLLPGEIFVHRNVANIVVHTDLNCLSVIQYAVEVLKVSDIIVCGHYGCGGVLAAMRPEALGLIDNWLRHIKDVYEAHRGALDAIEDATRRADRLCELNVITQAANVCYTTIVQDAWRRGQTLAVHACVYGLQDGHIRDLGFDVTGPGDLPLIHRVGG
jgi:carbonic anhydrase